jgi:hypothetical protein
MIYLAAFAARFQDSRLNSALIERIVMDACVIDREGMRDARSGVAG